MTTKTDTATTTETHTAATDETTCGRPVPFFARKLGRPALAVRSGIRAGLHEEESKRG
ncbi:MAG: hypothetical protein H6710_00575 [Myxococcales bacterium]|nr:hypothetical protein [Myxococcales bacterium]MCB9703131.1 hypothetical protein [Myxococcales bacterium]